MSLNKKNNNNRDGFFAAIGSSAFFILLLIVSLILVCGCSAKKVVQVPVETKVETKYIHVERLDTVYVEVPAQSVEKVCTDTFSLLSTDYAVSAARIDNGGLLHHSLSNRTDIKHPVTVVATIDTVFMYKVIEKPIEVQVPVEVERELTWWQRVRLDTWAGLLICFLTCIVWLCRKPILNFIRNLIKR